MPLSKKRNRDRMRVSRATYVQPNVVQPTTEDRSYRLVPDKPSVRRCSVSVLAKEVSELSTQTPTEIIPLYNPAKHRPGDKVRMSTGQVVVIPELDADGNRIW